MGSKPSRVPIGQNNNESTVSSSAVNFENIADRSPGMIDVYHYPSGKYVYVNKAVEHLVGYTPAEMLEGGLKFYTSKIHPDDVEGSVVRYEIACKSVAIPKKGVDDSKPFISVEYRIRHKHDGRWVWLHTDARVFSRMPDGSLECIVNTCVDITEQKRIQEKLQQLARQLQASEFELRAEHDQLIALNVAKDEFVSIASHQLRMPATGVKQYIGLLLQGYAGELTDTQHQILQTAYDSNERQLDIITDLLNTSRLDAGKVQPHKTSVNIISLVHQVIAELHEKSQARQQHVLFRHEDKAVKVNVDERLMLMVIENLLDNAIKYSPEGGDIELNLQTNGKTMSLYVKDQGIGISKPDQKKLFRKFSRIENSSTENITGTGLGLYWAKKIVDLHKGDIRLETSSKKGSTFSIELPLTTAKSRR